MVDREDLIDAMVSRDVESMDMKDLIRLAYDVFEDRFESYSDEELQFAARMQQHIPQPAPLEQIREVENVSGTVGKGSTDVGDVSWVVPTTGFSTACWVPGTPGHSWQAVACGGTTVGEKGMHLASRTLAAATVELMLSDSILKAAQAEHQRRTNGKRYEPLIPEGMQPPLNYRRPPKAIAE